MATWRGPGLLRLTFFGLMVAIGVTGCSTSADMAYSYRAHAIDCEKISQDIAQARRTSDYKRLKALNQQYYFTCVDK